MAIEFICDHCGTRYTLSMVMSGPPSEERADQLVKELMEQQPGGDTEEGGVATAQVGQVRLAPAKPAPAKTAPGAAARSSPQEKPEAAPAKTKPRDADDEAVPRVSPKYWITLAVLALTLTAVWGFGARGNPTPEQLARTALTDPDKANRAEAAAALSMIQQPDPTNHLRQLAEKSDDPGVLIPALNGLWSRGDNASLPIFFAALEHADAGVRAAAWNGVLQIYKNNVPEDLEFKPDGPSEERTRVARRLKTIREELLAKAPKNAKV